MGENPRERRNGEKRRGRKLKRLGRMRRELGELEGEGGRKMVCFGKREKRSKRELQVEGVKSDNAIPFPAFLLLFLLFSFTLPSPPPSPIFQVCDFPENSVPCEASAAFYNVNNYFGRVDLNFREAPTPTLPEETQFRLQTLGELRQTLEEAASDDFPEIDLRSSVDSV